MRSLLLFWLCLSSLLAAQELEPLLESDGLFDGPAFDGSGGLYIPDVKARTLQRYAPKTKQSNVLIKDAGRFSATFFAHGKLYVSDVENNRVAILKGNKLETWFAFPEAKPPVRSNDLVADQRGGIYVTVTRQGQVWYLHPDGKKHTIVDAEIETPNGLILSPDGKTLYVAAYVPKKIYQYPVKPDGTLGKRTLFATMDDGPDKGADGMTVDRAGNVFCAGAKDVWVWSPSGALVEKIRTPTRPINAAFAGPGEEHLYITCLGQNGIKSSLVRMKRDIYGVSPFPPRDVVASANKKRPSTALADHITIHENVVYDTVGERKLLVDILQPHVKHPLACIVIVHGGGWRHGDKTKFRALATRLAAKNYVVAAVEYRLAGEAPFPAGVRDCNRAVRFLRENAAQYKIQPNKIGVVGGSAGGHIAGLMATGWKQKELSGERVQAVVVMAGPMEMTSGSVADRSRNAPDSNANVWLRGKIDEKPELYKLSCAHTHIDKDSAPILFMVGEHDVPERNAPSRKKLTEAGVWTDVKIYDDGKHGCWNQLPFIDPMAADMDAFFKQRFQLP